MEKNLTGPSKFNRTAVSVSEAQALIVPYINKSLIETIPLIEAHGRTLAEDVTSPHPYPFFRRSVMDGFAIHSDDTLSCSKDESVWLEVVDEIPCGFTSSVPVGRGQAARIMTGAHVPDETDAVVMLEMTENKIEDGRTYIRLQQVVTSGTNVTPIGFELDEGELILQGGRQILAGEMSVLATFGIHHVNVYRRPTVAIFATGTELLELEDPLQPGKIRNSNSYMLASQVREAGGEPIMLGSIMDDLALARLKVEEALEKYDLVVTSGGVSVGDYDIMGDLVRQDDVTMLFNKVSMRPGSVTTAAVKGGKLLFALSGNPGACFVGFELFVGPAIRKMMGVNNPYLPEWTAVLGTDYNRRNSFTRFVRARLDIREGMLYALPANIDESGVMVTIKDSDCLIVIPPETEGIKAGEQVKIIKLQGNRMW
ncbi:gephyrin-like molybdotransferase Glp [Paenibacillus sediminis]|uniref:Molybdopterin molybdenumtransferase n=1 Tax=Paenibacillus sediminis TaxID=664909 RepID=A0ABS4H0C0_9BACL|nr:gephyrin-like molybdotransferase Glp [Paenibacillus sediminis]MBP1935964.1 molybdopterin molybdotransferase [Paenibacillus sediminis]